LDCWRLRRLTRSMVEVSPRSAPWRGITSSFRKSSALRRRVCVSQWNEGSSAFQSASMSRVSCDHKAASSGGRSRPYRATASAIRLRSFWRSIRRWAPPRRSGRQDNREYRWPIPKARSGCRRAVRPSIGRWRAGGCPPLR
jgi:hypothetical protein